MAEMKVQLPSTEPALPVPGAALAAIGERFKTSPRPWIVLGMGALHAEREWPHAYWLGFVAKLRGETAGTIFYIGGPAYMARAQSIMAQRNLTPAVNACDLTLVQAVALLHHADLFVGTDSGPMNLAAAVGTPAFAMFGVNPVLNYSRFIHPLTPPGGPHPGGMQLISPAHVFEQVKPHLSRQKSPG
jgi:heptosyltransferase-2